MFQLPTARMAPEAPVMTVEATMVAAMANFLTDMISSEVGVGGYVLSKANTGTTGVSLDLVPNVS